MIQTKRLLIRSYEKGDEAAVYKVINSAGIAATTLNIPYPYPREQLSTWMHFTLKNSLYKRGYEFGVFLTNQSYIGHVGIVNVDWINSTAELTYFIGESYWGQGYATEAVKAMIQFGFIELGIERLLGRCMTTNPASLCVMKKCGLSYEGRARHEVLKNGHYRDVWHAAILKEDSLEPVLGEEQQKEWPIDMK